MSDSSSESFGLPLSIASEHGPLHATLGLQPDSPGIVVLVHAGLAVDGRDGVLAGLFRQAGLSTLSIDLLAKQEEAYADVHNNVPLLSKRLLEFLNLIHHRVLLGEIPEQPLALCGAGVTSPVVVRVAAQRDHDIAAVVCRGGLIDLAGVLYLHALESPLLLLLEEGDEQHITSSRRTLREVRCSREIRIIPEIGIDFAASAGFEIAARESAQWFVRNFSRPR